MTAQSPCIYISGISGTGMGALALMAKTAGFTVFGSDRSAGPVTKELTNAKINFHIGPQDGAFLQKTHQTTPLQWFIHTSALPPDHPELVLARQLNLKVSKRDELISFLISHLKLKLIAVAGTHGKTTTTAMLVWAAKQLNLNISYLVGTTLGFAPAGVYHPGSDLFIYEADEYDRNFLTFHPYLSLITNISYDHPDTYPTPESYHQAFNQFIAQSDQVITTPTTPDQGLTLAGPARRLDAALALSALSRFYPNFSRSTLLDALNSFPGVGRRFERLVSGVYSDYAHHPEEISTTIALALEEVKRLNKSGLIVIYQPHQNTRQHQVLSLYPPVFRGVTKLFWLPTFLTREDPTLPVLTPQDFIPSLDLSPLEKPPAKPFFTRSPKPSAEPALLNDALARRLKNYHRKNYLILLLTAGPADSWLRQTFPPTSS